MKRKFLCAVLSLLMVVSLLPIVVGADETSVLDLAFTQRETAVGATEVRVGVDMSGNPGLVTATIPVKWDNNVLHLKSVTPSTDIIGSGWCGMSMDEYTSNGTYYLAWNNDTRTEGDYTTATGCLAELVFTIVDPDVDTSTELKFDLTDERANMMTYSMADLCDSGLTATTTKVNLTAAESGTEEPDPEPSDGAKMTIGNAKGKAGNTVDVTIKFESKNGFGGMAFDVKYDNTVLTLENVTSDVKFTTTPIAKCDGKCNFQFADTQNNTDIDNFVTLTFKIADGTDDGTTTITVVMEDGTQFYYDGQTEVDFDVTVIDGGVTIYSFVIGDATGDEKVNNRDAARILQYLASWDVEIQLEACDVTGDGKVNNRDAARILQQLAGWDVTFAE